MVLNKDVSVIPKILKQYVQVLKHKINVQANLSYKTKYQTNLINR